MKRSEVVSILKQAIKDHNIHGKFINDSEASQLLTKLEDIGMLPPTLENESFKINDSGEMTYQVNKWEPEDEK